MTELNPFITGEPPRDSTKQYLAWAIDRYSTSLGEPKPRWCVVQWRREYGKEYWAWSVPGLVTSVEIIEYAVLPRMDRFGQYSLERMLSRADEP